MFQPSVGRKIWPMLLLECGRGRPRDSRSRDRRYSSNVMALFRAWCLALIFSSMAPGQFLRSQALGEHTQNADHGPALLHTCLITSNVKRLVDFYEPVLNLKAKWSGNDYAEFVTGVGVLAIFSADAQEKYIPGSAEAAKNRSLILEFEVDNVDEEYRRLESLVKVWVKPPTTQPWGTRSVYFRDLDGNLVDFYTPAKAR
jgi:catechol 2,3-dioxygenase-like lactoylglutathione lyase family enzyme